MCLEVRVQNSSTYKAKYLFFFLNSTYEVYAVKGTNKRNKSYSTTILSLIFINAGKLNRGLSVIDSYQLLQEGRELTEDEIFLASALGWCIEWVKK